MIARNGFTAVELMVTLFVAVLFILSGYQLYGAVTLRSANSREMSEASNVGYEVLRKEGSVYKPTSNSCAAPSEEAITNRTGLKIPNPSIRILRCKPIQGSSLIQVTVSVKYGQLGTQREVLHATYVSG